MVIDEKYKNEFMRVLIPIVVWVWCLVGCKKGEVVVPPVSTETLQSVASFPIGASVDPNLLKNNVSYRDVVSREYSSLTVENAMKWSWVHPAQNTFDFAGADYIVDFAVAQKKRVHGHCLVWYSSNPDWLTQFQGDSVAWEGLLKTHIMTVVGHYKGKVASWDVVNEAIDEDGSFRTVGNIWWEKLGTGYIERAFQYAHQADPDALLFYNEYGQEWSPRKRDAEVRMVADFQRRGVPIHGLGMQAHTDIAIPENLLQEAMVALAQTGLKVHVSELDVSVNPQNDGQLTFTDALKATQSDRYRYIGQTYKAVVPVGQRHGITTWNVGDGDSWIVAWLKRNDWPLLFDGGYKRKVAYDGFLAGIR